jgi:hypothetical protein
MDKFDILQASLLARFDKELVLQWRHRCRPRVLMLVDGLSYNPTHGFGLWRFLHAITLAPGVTQKPVLTLAHRFTHPLGNTVNVGPDSYTVINGFDFATAATSVTLAHYDQIWIFGIGSGSFSLSDAEVAVVSEFMNGGGGVFATGDHASLGRELSGSLPRIRHMREWRDAASGGVPMGAETDAAKASMRIDTVVNPGSNGVYEFADQSDTIPQRIYPNYKTVDTDGPAGPGWSATVHPLLMRPGAPATRSSSDASPSAGFTQDIDVFPDHPHESVCYAVSGATLSGHYTVGGQNFHEFQPRASLPLVRVGSEIVAFGVSGGRSVLNGEWKPPVHPRMFGISSAYDGRLAQPYAGKTQRPGRIVCDSTWHHYININLDGTESGRNGLGTGTGLAFVPSPDLEKIYTYYRNALNWLQPANRVWCPLFWDLVATRLNPALFEELIDIDRLVGWRDLVGLGRQAKALVTSVNGRATVRDQVLAALLSDPRTQVAADVLSSDALATTVIDPDELLDGVYGALLAEVARIVPGHVDEKEASSRLGKGPEPHLKALQERMAESFQAGLRHQALRLERSLAAVTTLADVKTRPASRA